MNPTTALDLGAYRFRAASGTIFLVKAHGIGRAVSLAGASATFIGKAW